MSISKVDNWCITEFKTVSCSYKWTIKNVCFETVRYPITSNTFSVTVGDELNIKWQLYLTNLSSTELSMGLETIFANKSAEALLKCTVLDNGDKQLFTFNSNVSFTFNSNVSFVSRTTQSIGRFRKIYGDRFSILLKYTITYGCFNTMRSLCPLPTVNECDLKPDFEKILENTKFCDVTLKLRDGREIQSHKVILAARSEVFASMFEHKMKESKENCVEIMDLDGDVCEEMLRFIYTGKVPKLNEMVENLLAVADKYNLEGLKTICIQEILSKLSIESAESVLYLADRYRLDQLNELVLEFLNTNAKEFIISKEFHKICQDNPDLLIKLYKAAVSKN